MARFSRILSLSKAPLNRGAFFLARKKNNPSDIWGAMIARLRLLILLIFIALLTACTGPSNSPEASSSTASAFQDIPTPRPYRLISGELQLAASPDDIPAIFASDALFVSAQEGSAEWLDQEPIIGVLIEEEARAYPIRLLSLHEIVNDHVGGKSIAVTWCPLCYTAIVFDRVVADRELTFGVSGYLFHNNLVMYDHQTETLWSQALGQAIRGAYSRTQLDFIGSQLSTWGAWKQAHPTTLVLSAQQMGRQATEILDPYAGYYRSGMAGLGGQASLDDRLPPKALVLGIRVGAEQRAYPFDTIRNVALINDELATSPILVLYNPELNTAAAFSRTIDGKILTFHINIEGQLVDQETGSQWSMETGQALTGPLKGTRLQRLAAPLIFWFAWSDIYPQTGIFLSDG